VPGEGLLRAFVVTSAGLLSVLDSAAMLCSGLLTAWLAFAWSMPGSSGTDTGVHYLLVVAALLGAIMLHDRQFGERARRGDWYALARYFLTRYLFFAGGVLIIGGASGALVTTPPRAVAVWLAFGFVLTSLVRAALVSSIRLLTRNGMLTESVAIVGAGSLANRLKQDLVNADQPSMRVIGVFDDDTDSARSRDNALAGTVDDLIELGKTRHLDWIFVNLPSANPQQLASIVRRLKALAVPIALCPWNVSLGRPYQRIDYVGGALPVTVLVDRRAQRGRATIQAACQFLPRWVTTLALLPMMLATHLRPSLPPAERAATHERHKLRCELDDYDVDSFTLAAAQFGQSRYGFVLTPNVDHLIRLHDDAKFRELYAAARYVLLDSRFLAHILRMVTGRRLPVCTGSDLTTRLLEEVSTAGDRIVVIGGNRQQMHALRTRFGFHNLVQFSPPMGFIHDPAAVETCLSFVEAHSPFRFCLLAVGSPQQEILAERLKVRDVARGLALCVGASIDFVTGSERRAPHWMQTAGLEWLFRLLQNPARMANRYLVRGPRVFRLLRKTRFVLRARLAPTVQQAMRLPDAAAVSVSALPLRLQPAMVVEGILPFEPSLTEQDKRLVVVVGGGAAFGAISIDTQPR
jgi:exopolysaccharide biosynthesis WecB/TagA/CpsF family protein